MAYIGKTPATGAIQNCDALSASGTADYTLQVGSVNVVPESVNHMIVSLNGVIQAPTTAYTVAGSTLSFASSLTSSDTIDFVMLLGNVLDIGTPSDATVSTAKIVDANVTTAKLATTLLTGATDIGGAIADADLFLLDDGAGGTLRKTAASRIKTYAASPAGNAVFNLVSSGNIAIANETDTKLTWTGDLVDTASGVDTTNNRWTCPAGYDGDYFFIGQVFIIAANAAGERGDTNIRINNTARITSRIRKGGDPGGTETFTVAGIYRLNATDYVELWFWHNYGSSQNTDANTNYTWLKGFRLNDE